MSEELTTEYLPKEVSRGVVEMAPGLEIEVVVLDNGQRIITEESMVAFLNWLVA